MIIRCRVQFAFATVILLFPSFAFSVGTPAAQQASSSPDAFLEQHRRAVAKNPEGITFTLRLKDDETRFQQGEIIRMELGFSSNIPNTYQLDAGTYDRSGRLGIDTFHLDPEEGAGDPLQDYMSFGGPGGGIRGMPILGEKPSHVVLELNEWLRFDRPGKYRLYLTSARIRRDRYSGEKGEWPIQLTATSDILEFEIIPTDQSWAEEELQKAMQSLDSEARDYRSACRTLRFLGTKDAVREMVMRYSDGKPGCGFHYTMGFFGTPHRAFVIREIERRLTLSDYPISQDSLRTLTQLRLVTKHPEPISPYSLQRQLFEEEMRKVLGEFIPFIEKKMGTARTESLYTLWVFSATEAFRDIPTLSSRVDRLPQDLIDVSHQLPDGALYGFLASYWDTFARPEMIPVLRWICENPPENFKNLDELALRRLYELAPEEGRKYILEEIRSLHPRIGIKALGLLPEETLPEMDSVFVHLLEKHEGGNQGPIVIPVQLIERYASHAIYPHVKGFYGEKPGRWYCQVLGPLLAYFLRVDPPYGKEVAEREFATLRARQSECSYRLFENVAKFHMNREFEEIVISALSDPDARFVHEAASVLARYGSEAAEGPLWRAFENHKKKWTGREEELVYRVVRKDPNSWEVGLEKEFLSAIVRGLGWLTDEKKLERLKELCLKENCRNGLDRLKRGWGETIYLTLWQNGEKDWRFEVAQYGDLSLADLKRKLVQFPQGTVFHLRPRPADWDWEAWQEAYSELKAFLQEHGMQAGK